ncbi:MAG: nucleotidyltransferase domain-containing protein [Candidatus Kuenenbacteria bacterium]
MDSIDLKPYKPEKIILYGSCARGDFRKNSDIDLLIIKETKENAFDRIGKVSSLIYKKEYFKNGKLPESIETLVYTPKELKYRYDLGDFFIKEILKQGKIIYEKK